MAKERNRAKAQEGGKFTPRKEVVVAPGKTDDETKRNVAAIIVAPEVAAYRVVNAVEGKSGIAERMDTPAMCAVLREQAKAVNRGELAHAEAMLMNQATALQSLFARLAERAMGNDTVPAFDVNMKMALRAQAQCRMTLETLAQIKNPAPVAFVRQANIAHGPQQVNNVAQPAPSRAAENGTAPNKLSEAQHGEWLDTRAPGAAGRVDPALEAVGAVHRPEDGSR